MALGLPVVATAVGGTPEVVKHGATGLLISTQNGAIPAALERLARDAALRARMGRAARQWVCKHLNLEHMVEQTEDVILCTARKR